MTKLDDLYAKLPSVMCKGLCHESCSAIPIAPAEREAIAKHTGRRVKVLTDVAINGPVKHHILRPKDPADLICPYLKQKRCSIHQARPLACRMFGTVASMPCPYGCATSSEPLTDEQARAIMDEVAKVK